MSGPLSIVLLFVATILSASSLTSATETCRLDTICFALDRSGSMRGFESNVQTFTVDAATEINRRTTDTSYSAYGFNTRSVEIQAPTKMFTSEFIPAVTAPYSSSGGTNILSGLQTCFDAVKGQDGNRVIVLVTDGRDGGTASNLGSDLREQNISVVTVGIGSGVSERHLKELATTEDFFLSVNQDNLVSNALLVAVKACEVVDEIVPVTPTPEPMSACEIAYDDCEFMFEGHMTVPTYSVTGVPDRVFTDTILSRTDPAVGVLNTNGITAEFINDDGTYKEITQFGEPRFTPTHFKPLSRTMKPLLTGVGHQTFHGNQETVARNQCIRLFFSTFQTISTGSNPRVMDNVNAERSDNKCVVFMTS